MGPSIRRVARGAIILSFVTMLSGCAAFQHHFITPRLSPEPFNTVQVEGRLTPGETELLAGRRIDTGVALSGGGLRAALYSIGAMRSLYEKGIIGGEADIISTVSGGGYAAYWLYANQYALEQQAPVGEPVRFGSATFEDARFYSRVCEMLVNANFVTTGAMFRSSLLGASTSLYDQRLKDVFGPEDRSDLKLHQLAPIIARREWPFLVINTTVNRPVPRGWSNGLFELTPVGTRGLGRGEIRWKNDRSIDYSKAVAISGAAFARFLAREVPEVPDRQPNGRPVVMHDGGPSENLGAVALIRRGVPNIIIIDAEHDPDYEFGAYQNLKTRLPRWGSNIVVPGIESHLASRSSDTPAESYFTGFVTTQRVDGSTTSSRIHYVKMSLPPALRTKLREQAEDGVGRTFHESYMDKIAQSYDSSTRRHDCGVVAHPTTELANWFGYAVSGYERPWNRTRRARMSGGFLALDFPQYSTGDQSMYQNQALAFIGLGYLQANQIRRPDK